MQTGNEASDETRSRDDCGGNKQYWLRPEKQLSLPMHSVTPFGTKA